MGAEQVTRQTLGDQVTRVLREAILLGEFKPGERLSEPELAGRLDVSLTPVREALSTLAAAGLVVRGGRRGTHVRRLTARDIDNLLSVREALEVLAVRQSVPRFTAREHELFNQILEEQAAATERVREEPGEVVPQLAELNERFHQLFLDYADNAWLVSMITSIQDVVVFARTRLRLVATPERRQESLAEHRRIVRAVVERDADAAARHMSDHVQRLKEHVLSLASRSDTADSDASEPEAAAHATEPKRGEDGEDELKRTP